MCVLLCSGFGQLHDVSQEVMYSPRSYIYFCCSLRNWSRAQLVVGKEFLPLLWSFLRFSSFYFCVCVYVCVYICFCLLLAEFLIKCIGFLFPISLISRRHEIILFIVHDAGVSHWVCILAIIHLKLLGTVCTAAHLITLLEGRTEGKFWSGLYWDYCKELLTIESVMVVTIIHV